MTLREKYRPSTVTDLVGCKEFTEPAQTWTLETCPPNLLFAGPPGVGKTSAAYALAKDLLGEYFDPMNFIVTNASDDRGIDYIRSLKMMSKQKGIGVSRRIIFLDEADNFTAPAQKALRQIMEESYKTTIFILTANDISAIHSAILDRCVKYSFKGINPEDNERLAMIIEQEGMPQEWMANLPHLIKFTGGSLRQAIDILDSLPRESDALIKSIKRDTQYLNKAAVNLLGGDFSKVTAYLAQALEAGQSRLGLLKGLRYRAKPLMGSDEEWHNFMLTYGEFVILATQWPDDDLAFVEYFIAKMKNNMEK